MDGELYNTLAVLLSYPEERTVKMLSAIGDRPSAISSELAAFCGQTCRLKLHEIQELFVQTFDLSPVCSLEMGWHLFGENYDRGLLLVKMRQQLRAYEVAESSELPDHLTNALRLIPRMEHDHAAYFVEAVVLSSLHKMIEAFSAKPERKRGEETSNAASPKDKDDHAATAEVKAGNPYLHVLRAVQHLLESDFPEVQFAGDGMNSAATPNSELRVLV